VWDVAKMWDGDAYIDLLQSLAEDDELPVTVDGDDLDALLSELGLGDEPADDPGAEVDRAEELREKWGVKTGDLWACGEHRIICGDCTDASVVERVMGGEKAGGLVADPPYGIDVETDFASIHTGHSSTCSGKHDAIIGDKDNFDFAHFRNFDAPEQFWWGADYYCHALPTGGSWIVWDKTIGKYDGRIGNEFELCWSKQAHVRKVIRHEWVGYNNLWREDTKSRIHPAQKPVEVIGFLLTEWIKKDALILDPFLGSGTTLVACEQLDRRCRGIELDAKYIAVTLERWSEMTSETPRLITEPSDG